MLGEWRMRATNQNEGLRQFFDKVERWCLAEETGSHRFVVDIASKLVSLEHGHGYTTKLMAGHVPLDEGDIYVARGIVAKKDKQAALISFGGLMMAVKGAVTSQLSVEDKVSLVL
jgi:hypothetical protein